MISSLAKHFVCGALPDTSKAANLRRSSKPSTWWHDLLQMLIKRREILLSQTLLHCTRQDIRRQHAVGAGLSSLPRQVCGHPQVLGEVGGSRTAVEGARNNVIGKSPLA